MFCNEIGEPLTPSQVEKALQKALVKAGLPRIRVHDLRHTAASLMLEAGVHPKIVQEFLGHSTVNLTLNIYSHVLPTLHKEIADKMGKILDEK